MREIGRGDRRMLFNQNIISEILRSSFGDKIEAFTDDCVMELDDYELADLFEETIDFAILYGIDEIEVEEYRVEEEGEGQKVSGTLEIMAVVDGFERIEEESEFRDTGTIAFGAGFSFHVEEGVYSDLELEYLY